MTWWNRVLTGVGFLIAWLPILSVRYSLLDGGWWLGNWPIIPAFVLAVLAAVRFVDRAGYLLLGMCLAAPAVFVFGHAAL